VTRLKAKMKEDKGLMAAIDEVPVRRREKFDTPDLF
jgi:hypothetical protein